MNAKKVFRAISNNFEEYFCSAILISMLVILLIQVITRTVFNYSNHWAEEYARYCNIYLIYFSAALAAKRQRHIRVDAIVKIWPKKIRRYVEEIGDYLWIAFDVVIIVVSCKYIVYLYGVGSLSQALNLPLWGIYLAIPLGVALMTVRLLVHKIKVYRHWNDGEPVVAAAAVKEV